MKITNKYCIVNPFWLYLPCTASPTIRLWCTAFCFEGWVGKYIQNRIQSEETATGASTGDDDWVIHVLWRWKYSISSLTWASCVAYSDWMAAKAWWRGKQEYYSHVFLLLMALIGSAGTNLFYYEYLIIESDGNFCRGQLGWQSLRCYWRRIYNLWRRASF